VTRQEEPAQTFNTEAEAERHFREKYLPALVAETAEAEIDGVTSRRLPDRGIARLIENAWSAEVGSPSSMMQELAGRFRGTGLQIFRHRKGMLFVSPLRLKPIDESAVSDSVRQILETLKGSPRINRKELAEKLIAPEIEPAEAEKAKLSLVSDLHWMIREGHVIEFNDSSLDLPRARQPKKEAGEGAISSTDVAAETSDAVVPVSDVAAAVAGGSENRTLPPETAAATTETASTETTATTAVIAGENADPARTEGASET
jgi:hypothetical protein